MSDTSLFPIYLARSRDADETTVEEYDQEVAVNEDNLNQDLNSLYTQILELQAQVAVLQAAATTTTSEE